MYLYCQSTGDDFILLNRRGLILPSTERKEITGVLLRVITMLQKINLPTQKKPYFPIIVCLHFACTVFCFYEPYIYRYMSVRRRIALHSIASKARRNCGTFGNTARQSIFMRIYTITLTYDLINNLKKLYNVIND